MEGADRRQHVGRAIPDLDVGGMNLQADQASLGVGVGDDGRLRPLIVWPASNPRGPPHWVVLTDWLPMTPAAGLASRPTFPRRAMTSMGLICASNPRCDQA